MLGWSDQSGTVFWRVALRKLTQVLSVTWLYSTAKNSLVNKTASCSTVRLSRTVH